MQQKSLLDDAAVDGGPHQVLACSIIGVMIQLTHAFYCGEENHIGR
jgi:hypothetical protein